MVSSPVKTIGVFALAWGLERFTLTLYNLCIVAFLADLSRTIQLAVVGSLYMVIQGIPVAILSLYMGPWLDAVDRNSSVPRALLVKVGSVSATLFVCGIVAFFRINQGGIFVILPLLILLIIGGSISGAMHLVLHLSMERLWVVSAANREQHSSRYLTQCNGFMSLACDVSQIVGLMFYGPLTTSLSPCTLYIASGALFIVLSVLELACFRALDQMLPPQMAPAIAQKRSVRLSFVEYWSQRDAPVGICWAARSTFTALWFSTTVMHHSPIGVLYRWLYFVTSISSTISYICSIPRARAHLLLTGIAVAEVVALLLATLPVLSNKLNVFDLISNSTSVEMVEVDVEQMTSIPFTDIVPQVFTVAIYVFLALSVIIAASANRLWDLTALQIYQETVPVQSRGTVGGVQVFLSYTALSFHALLAFTAHGKGYAWTCASIGLTLSLFNLATLLWWRRVKKANSERVELLKRETVTAVDLPKD